MQSQETDVVVKVTNLTKIYNGKVCVDNLNLTLHRGKIYGFLGTNGSGKTTTLQMICGLKKPTHGHGSCLGISLNQNLHHLKKNIGYMSQYFSLYEELTVLENLKFSALIYDIILPQQRINYVVDLLKLHPYLSLKADALSGGWKRKLSLAVCILHDPKILFLDEPTAGVDPASRQEFWDLFYEFSNQKMTILVSTHYMDEAERCHNLIYLNQGQLVFSGGPQQLIQDTGLSTWQMELPDEQYELEEKLRALGHVEQICRFGRKFHLSGRQKELLETSITSYSKKYNIPAKLTSTSLEDTLIFLAQQKAKI